MQLLKLLICGILLFIADISLAQVPGIHIGGEYFSGKLLIHRPTLMTFDVLTPVRGGFIEVSRNTNGNKFWHKIHGYPRTGWRIGYWDFGNPQVLGQAFGLQPFADFYLFRSRHISGYFRYAMGLAWVTRPFDRVENTENTAIGSHLNNMTSVSLGSDIRVNQHLRLRLSGSFIHVSNARFWYPNLGLNSIVPKVGLHYEFEEVKQREHTPPADTSRRYLRPVVNLRFGLGFKEEKVSQGPKYPVYIASLFISKMLSRKNKVFIGYEVFSDQAIRNFRISQDLPETSIPPVRQNVYLGHEFIIGQVGIMTQVFLYVDRPFQTKNYFGLKLGPQWYFFKPQNHPGFNVFGGIYLKTHYAVADYPELLVGVSF